MSRILAIGISTLDIVNLYPGYPTEDSEIRARPITPWSMPAGWRGDNVDRAGWKAW